MGAPSNTFITATLNLIKNDTPHLALYTTNPTAADSGTEVTGYTRKPITFSSVSIVNGVGTITNAAEIVFTDIPTGTVTHYGIKDALAAGDLLMFGQLSSSAGVVAGDELRIPIGALTVSYGG